MALVEIVGYDDLDLVTELIAHRAEILVTSTAENGMTDGILSELQNKEQREQALRQRDFEHKHAKLVPAVNRGGQTYPHVYQSHTVGNTLSIGGRKYGLPIGSRTLDYDKYQETTIPSSKVGTLGAGRKLIEIDAMDGLCKRTFKGYKTLNRMQSLVYPVAYKTSENMLICAPTGAGKTDAAMLAILNAIGHNISPNPMDQPDATEFIVQAEDFKVVYVAPMKALAAEITEKLGKRLAWLGINVREFTGDMHLTKKEIVQTQIIVTTPEKWDVVTRKSTGVSRVWSTFCTLSLPKHRFTVKQRNIDGKLESIHLL